MSGPLDIARLRVWEGRQETGVETIAPWRVAAFRAMLDLDPASLESGTPVPKGLHWCLAQPTAATADLGPDGHPARGGFLPPVPLPRRMWAGGRLTFRDDLRIGDAVTRISTVTSVVAKEGRTGSLVFVTVSHRISTERGPAIDEEQDLVYRALDAPASGAGRPRDAGQIAWDVVRTVDPSPVLLFRYSALTFNGHRIHYDRQYVTEIEGYPGLIVHGPLQATLLIGLADEICRGGLAGFSFRGTKPLFDIASFSIAGRRGGEGAELAAFDSRGDMTMSATAEAARR